MAALKLHAAQTSSRGRCMCGGWKLRAILYIHHPRKRHFYIFQAATYRQPASSWHTNITSSRIAVDGMSSSLANEPLYPI